MENIYFSQASTDNKFVVARRPSAVLCAIASAFYCMFSILSFSSKYTAFSRFMNKITDAVFFSLLLSILIRLDDMIQIILMFSTYTGFHLAMLDVSFPMNMFTDGKMWTMIDMQLQPRHAIAPSVTRLMEISVQFGCFWGTYFFGLVYNWPSTSPGQGVAQIFSSFIVLVDAYHVYRIFIKDVYAGNTSLQIAIELALRFILLVCVFVETV